MNSTALVSCSDKTGLIELLSPLVEEGWRIYSTGGTAQYLKKNGIPSVEISEMTQFPEVMGGRVKTLHPMVHMSLLAREDVVEDLELLKKYQLSLFNLVVVNLYPFEKVYSESKNQEELIENIDIGGPTMLRSAAKNYSSISVLCDPKDYSWYLQNRKTMSKEDRRALAGKVFSHVSVYDSLVARSFLAEVNETKSLYPIGGALVQTMRYGENPQQKAAWYRISGESNGLHLAENVQGKELSYNNLLDLDAATLLVQQFDQPTVVAVKHNNPCGVASGKTIEEALARAIKADPVSVFGGIIVCNREISETCAEFINNYFIECVLAPQINEKARIVFSSKKNLRVLQWPSMLNLSQNYEIKSLAGGFLYQEKDQQFSKISDWTFLNTKPSDEIMKDLIFAEKIVGALKSNAIAIVKNEQTIGLGMGQVNRVDAVVQAIERMKKNHGSLQNVVLASDAFFPFADSIELCADSGIQWVMQPGGSIKDEEVKKKALELRVNLVLTGTRHFKH